MNQDPITLLSILTSGEPAPILIGGILIGG